MSKILEYFEGCLRDDGRRRNFHMENYLKKISDNEYLYKIDFNHGDYTTSTKFIINGSMITIKYFCDYFASAYPDLCDEQGNISQVNEFDIDDIDGFLMWYNNIAKTIYNPFIGG